MTDVQRDLERAKCLEQAELYDDMKDSMKKVVESGHELKTEDRNLLSVAYKNVVGKQRSVWRIISAKEIKLQSSDDPNPVEKEELDKIKQKTEENLKTICNEVVDLIDTYLLNASEDESKVFYYKMKGDYYRYLAEVQEQAENKEKAGTSYDAAQRIATEKLASTHPIRLGLALNYSVFHYEIKNEPDKACQLAKKAFDDAISDLDQLKEDSYKDSTLIMQLLRDNLTLWTSDAGHGDIDGDEGD